LIFRTAERQDPLVGVRGKRRRRLLAFLCWLLFAAGLLVQLVSPRLKISNRAFVIPPQMSAGKNAIRLDEIIGGQRRMQVLSALLTVSGAVGLTFLFRDILIGATRKTLDEENPTQKKPKHNESY
jgi:hypothetical protein